MARQNKAKISTPKTKQRRLKLSEGIIIALIGVVGTIIASLLGSPLIDKLIVSTSIPTEILSLTQNPATIIVATDFVTSIPFKTPAPRITPTTYIGTLSLEVNDIKGVPMRLIPAGIFIMGSTVDQAMAECMKYYSSCERSDFIDQDPPHEVDLDSFYIDKYEVTNAFYQQCVDANICQKPNDLTGHYGNLEFANHPVVFVNWNMAKDYCEWRTGRLPTEAEWEKAARGIDGRPYPWGEGLGCDYANYSSTSDGYCMGDTTPVGSYELGKSQYGVYDMAGNVWEFVSSLSKPYPYNASDGREDLIASGARIIRGGGFWNFDYYGTSSTYRYPINTREVHRSYGFRCAHDINP